MELLTLQATLLDVDLGRRQVILHEQDARTLGVHPGDNLRIHVAGQDHVIAMDTTKTLVPPGTIGILAGGPRPIAVRDGEPVATRPAGRAESVQFIKQKMAGAKLTGEQIDQVIVDAVNGTLGDIELTALVTSLEINDMDMDEIEHLTRSMVKHGEVLDFGAESVVFDKHSIGGVPGNKISLLIVPIVAAAGLMIPKTSSRAVTGAAGTADLMEVFGPVTLSGSEIMDITRRVGGVLCWGGGVDLAPADDILIRVQNPLSLDPRGLLLASVMAKKKAVGANKVVMDLPMGDGSKLPTIDAAKKIGRMFIELGERLDMQVECAVTYGGQPVGKTIGCALEANEALAALRGLEAPTNSLVEKSTAIAGIILEMGGLVAHGKGKARAMELMRSGEALAKFTEIVEAQNGRVPKGDVHVGRYSALVESVEGGYISGMSNRALVNIARAAGSPKEHGAGVIVHHKRGDRVGPGETLLTLHAESEYRLQQALALARKLQPIHVEGMLISRMPEITQV